MSWTSLYLSYSDEALIAFANPGLLRRAAKDLEAGLLSWTRQDADSGALSADGQQVELDARGLASARCSCPAPGVCKHKLAAVLFIRNAQPAADAAPVSTPDAQQELLELDPAAIFRSVGVANLRRAGSLLPRAGQAELTPQGRELLIALPALQLQVRYLAGTGFAGMLSEAPDNQRAALHLCAVLGAWHQLGRQLELPEELRPVVAAETLGSNELAFVTEVQDILCALLASGLSHLSELNTAGLQALNMSARSEALPRLASELRQLAGLLAALVARSEHADENAALSLIAQVYALCAGLRASGGAALAGQLRRAYRAGETLELISLGGHWWQQRSGARGLTLAFWDFASGSVLPATQARSDASDPNFKREIAWGHQALWKGTGTAERVAGSGGVRLLQPRLSEDQRLATSGDTQGELLPPLAIDDPRLSELGISNWQQLETQLRRAQLHSSNQELLVLRPHATGAPRLDELKQRVIWPLRDAQDSTLELTLPSSPEQLARIQALERTLERALPVFAVTVVLLREPELELQPVSLLLAEHGVLRSVSLDFVPAPPPDRKAAAQEKLAGRILKLQSDRRKQPTPARVPGLAQKLMAPVLAALEAQACSGLPRLPDYQKQVLTEALGTLRAVGLDSTAYVLESYLQEALPGRLLQLYALAQALLQLDLRLPISLD